MSLLDGLNQDFRDMVEALVTEGADFLIVGAYSVSYHGHPRATGDLDLLVRPTAENAARVWRALQRFGAPAAALGITEADLTNPDIVCQIGLPPRRIDLLTSLSGVRFEEAWAGRSCQDWHGRPICFLGLDALLANKRIAGRPKDLADIDALLRLHPRS